MRGAIAAACLAQCGAFICPLALPGAGIAPHLRPPPHIAATAPHASRLLPGVRQRVYPCLAAAAAEDDYEWSGLAGAPAISTLSVLNLVWENGATGADDLEVLSELLMEMGAISVVIEDSALGGDDMRGHWSSIGWGWGEVGGNSPDALRDTSSLQQCRISSYFPESHDIPGTVDALVSAMDLAAVPMYTIEPVSNDWSQESQRAMQPVLIGDLLLRFPWHTDQDTAAFVREQGKKSQKSVNRNIIT
jgi:hypothetical protein